MVSACNFSSPRIYVHLRRCIFFLKTSKLLITPGGDGIEAAAVVEPTVDGHDRPRPGAPNLASNLPHWQIERDLFAFRSRGVVALEKGPRTSYQPLYTSNPYNR